jgi:hypothetical protein
VISTGFVVHHYVANSGFAMEPKCRGKQQTLQKLSDRTWQQEKWKLLSVDKHPIATPSYIVMASPCSHSFLAVAESKPKFVKRPRLLQKYAFHISRNASLPHTCDATSELELTFMQFVSLAANKI